MIEQLRLYTINPDNKDAFLSRFRDHAARIMRDRYGFEIKAMWLSQEDDALRFVYLLSWPSVEAKQKGWADFMADEEWAEIKRTSAASISGELVFGIEDIMLNAVRTPE